MTPTRYCPRCGELIKVGAKHSCSLPLDPTPPPKPQTTADRST